ncbi:SDR family NAD(P)-dependent oxidoreductase [Kitasatospora purpeofusca]|uniref:SDR family NAD(P)-dependent oxidoreductase n=1 Tax=Kitasatospora purpeofusca TaxID=67352 RepID=UPI002251BF58|nr:SDR family NAD(P)-dependent oxidoreductase [Kitasatospora purpeofusca]MCX4755859.1 SDR family NAD(P)-dependent oxidoreductase [Kitasatospora purpeofusca]WSR36287.1 SDR family NAD(P)-dependent oxidoreductase [Kitasatospora purpeofusca]WSR44576.1 SDR family NAD(P)-dependent oxidoreductase [Kitasatospora purpeofusca]
MTTDATDVTEDARSRSRRPRRRPADNPPIALVTGASSGIGAATADRLAAVGWRLLLSGTDQTRLDAVAARTGGRPLPADLAKPDGAQRLAEAALAAAGRVDALIAGAGLGWRGPFAQTPTDTLDRMLEVNLAAPLRLARLLLPAMLERDRGRIVLLGSIAGQVGVRDEAAYAATKAGLTMFAESLWYELRGTGVGVRLILPGAVATPFFATRGTDYQRERPRPVSAEAVADLVHTAITTDRDRAFLPHWLDFPARIHGAAPGFFRRMAARFG